MSSFDSVRRRGGGRGDSCAAQSARGLSLDVSCTLLKVLPGAFSRSVPWSSEERRERTKVVEEREAILSFVQDLPRRSSRRSPHIRTPLTPPPPPPDGSLTPALARRFGMHPSPTLIPRCSGCQKDANPGYKRCSGCRSLYYCSRVCQVAHWKEHKGQSLNLPETNGHGGYTPR